MQDTVWGRKLERREGREKRMRGRDKKRRDGGGESLTASVGLQGKATSLTHTHAHYILFNCLAHFRQAKIGFFRFR